MNTLYLELFEFIFLLSKLYFFAYYNTCRAELGRFPLIIAINQKIINYFLYLHNKGNDFIVKQIFLMSADLHSSKSSFYSSVMRMSEYYNLPDFDPNVLNI